MNKRDCRKCGKYIPYQKTIDGKRRSLKGRKFCLECSPFKTNNRNRTDPSIPPKCKRLFKDWTNEERTLHYARVYKTAIKRKRELVEMFGGCCEQCGYSKCLRGLSFHHKIPRDKCFEVNVSTIRQHNWTEVLNEVAKCQLLCLCCHAEVEDAIARVNEKNYKAVLSTYVPRPLNQFYHTCQRCSIEFVNEYKHSKFCSYECCRIYSRKVSRPSAEQLMADITNNSWLALGRKYGVSDNAVRKWARQYGLIE